MLPGLGGVTCGKVVKKTLTLHKLNQYPLPVAFFHKGFNISRDLNIYCSPTFYYTPRLFHGNCILVGNWEIGGKLVGNSPANVVFCFFSWTFFHGNVFMEIVFWWEIESGFCRRPSPANVVFCFTEKQDLFLCWHLIFSKGKPSH